MPYKDYAICGYFVVSLAISLVLLEFLSGQALFPFELEIFLDFNLEIFIYFKKAHLVNKL